ncbi:MAG: restriction endonuclease [Phycisphaerae bacterium]|nr:restriction endonuclease [Phycisphaerae bacterium]
MTKANITRTLGPIHFEDLDPHRFEDLTRQLVYDFRQWQTIESTGRGGADDGFDVRAYEVLQASATIEDDESEEKDAPHPMDGNLWMIQCKREKVLGPKRVEDIIKDGVNPDVPPYGYILAAPANFSKAAHDKFREALRSRGVMEFYLWGAGELEDMLYQPKNDHILFAFFGVSLTSRRRSKTTEIRATVNAKNKLLRILGDDPNNQPVLLRDLKDASYPYKDDYKDFDKRPRWKEYSSVEFHPLGLIVSVGRYYAYIDKTKGVWDFTEAVNAIHAQWRRDVERDKLENSVKGFWELLPRANKAMLVDNRIIRFDSIVFIDDKGDNQFKCPHLFVDFHSERGPFSGSFEYLEINQHHEEYLDKLERTTIFPKTFQQPSFGTIYKDKFIILDDKTRSNLKYRPDGITLYDADKKFAFLKPTDVIGIEKSEDNDGKKTLIKICNKRMVAGKEMLDLYNENLLLKQQIEDQIARELNPDDKIDVIEALVIYDWQIEQNRPVI